MSQEAHARVGRWVTTTPDFPGYKIDEVFGVVSGFGAHGRPAKERSWEPVRCAKEALEDAYTELWNEVAHVGANAGSRGCRHPLLE